jgi:hypothetical protein
MRAELVARQADAARLLQAAGWQVTTVRPEQPVEQVWAQLGSSAAAWTGGKVVA